VTSVITFQETIAVSNTAQQLPSNPVVRSVTINTPATNRAAIVLSDAPNVTIGGYILEPGESVTFALPGGDTAALWAIGLAGDVLSGIGT